MASKYYFCSFLWSCLPTKFHREGNVIQFGMRVRKTLLCVYWLLILWQLLATEMLLKIKVLHDATEEPFLSKWFHIYPLTSEEPFCFTEGSLWRKNVLQIIKRIIKRRDGSLKNLWLNGSSWNQKWLFNGIAVKNLLSTFIFKTIYIEMHFSPQSGSRSAAGWGKVAYLSGPALSSPPLCTPHHHPGSPRPSSGF